MIEEIKNDANEDAQPKETVAMQLVMTIDGQLKVMSPFLQDKMACYGLLELAKDAVKALHEPKIVKPHGGIMDFVRNGKH